MEPFPPFFNLIISPCFGNTAAALVPIKHSELNSEDELTRTQRERACERENKEVVQLLSGEFFTLSLPVQKSRVTRSAAAQSLTAIIKQQQQRESERNMRAGRAVYRPVTHVSTHRSGLNPQPDPPPPALCDTASPPVEISSFAVNNSGC